MIAAAFLAVQVSIISVGANGPFVDEGLYTVAGLRVLEGHGLSDGYMAWFNGSPFVWPVIAALGHHLGGLAGARFMAAILSAVTLVVFARTAETLFGESAAEWGTMALGVNGLFMALAHFAVYDVPALTGIAVAMWCVTRLSISDHPMWPVAAAIAFALAVITKYGYLLMVVPLSGLVVSVRGPSRAGLPLVVFLSVAGGILATYFLLFFGSLLPTSMGAYLEQTFRRTRGHIAVLQMIHALGPLVLASAGAIVGWRKRHRMLVVTCLFSLALYPAFHLWTANFVSSQKHVVPGFLFAYLLAGVALERLWTSRSRVAVLALLTLLTIWGGVQWYWQEHSWSDTRTLANYLVQHMRRGDTVVADSSWLYILSLYPKGLIESPSDVIDARYSPAVDRLDLCQVTWLVGDTASTEKLGKAVRQCGHRRMLSSAIQQYYFDTSRLRLDTYTVIVGVYRLPAP